MINFSDEKFEEFFSKFLNFTSNQEFWLGKSLLACQILKVCLACLSNIGAIPGQYEKYGDIMAIWLNIRASLGQLVKY